MVLGFSCLQALKRTTAMSKEKNKDVRVSIRCIILCDNLFEIDITIIGLNFNFSLPLLFYCYARASHLQQS